MQKHPALLLAFSFASLCAFAADPVPAPPATPALPATPAVVAAPAEPPMEWVDPDTGHRVLRLSREPGTASLYFHQNAYSADGKKLVVTNRHGIATINLGTRETEQVVEGRVNVLVTGHKTGNVFYLRDGAVFATDLDTKATREVAKLPAEYARFGNVTINCDESLIVGLGIDSAGQAVPRALPHDGPPGGLEGRWAQGLPMVLFTINIATGEVKKIYRENDWSNHLQCSPTDPGLIMFCHEGPWHYNDRTWLIRADGTGLTQVHTRTMEMEIAGHEFFGPDGRTVWYDLQTPRSTVFWLAGYEIATGRRTWYHLERKEWSVHYNVSPDGTLFAGDGGGPGSVAAPDNGQWIYLFRPELQKATLLPAQKNLIRIGTFKAERLVNLAKHDYHLEPNLTFSPDMKWIIFRSNMFGPTHVFAVELAKAN